MRRATRTSMLSVVTVMAVMSILGFAGPGGIATAGADTDAQQVAMPRYTRQTANQLERGILDQLGRQTGAKAAMGPAGWKSMLATVTATNEATSTELAGTLPPRGKGRGTRAAVPAVSEAQAFSGVIDGIIEDARGYGAYRPQSPKGAHIEEGAGRKTTSTDADGNPVTVSTTGRTVKDFEYANSTVGVDVRYTATTTVTAEDGTVLSTIDTKVHARFELFTCPATDGSVKLWGHVDAAQTNNGKTADTLLEVNGTGTVNDDAYLEDVDWYGSADNASNHVMTGGTVQANRLGKPMFHNLSADLVEGTNTDLANFQMQLAETTMQLAATMAQDRWRSGACVEIRTTDEGRGVTPNAVVPFTATVWHKVDGNQLDKEIVPELTRTRSLDPDHGRQPTPLDLTYTAGDKVDSTGTVTLTSTSNRGRAVKVMTFTVVEPGWTLAVPAEAADLLIPGGKVCDLSKPWSVTITLRDTDVELVWTYQAVPTGGGRTGTLSATLSGEAGGGAASGTASTVDYELVAAPAGYPAGSLGIRYLDGQSISAQVEEAWSVGAVPGGGAAGLVLRSDPGVCAGK